MYLFFNISCYWLQFIFIVSFIIFIVFNFFFFLKSWALSAYTTGHANSTFVNRLAFLIGLGGVFLIGCGIYLLRRVLDRFGIKWFLITVVVIILSIVGYIYIYAPSAKEEWYLGLALDPRLG